MDQYSVVKVLTVEDVEDYFDTYLDDVLDKERKAKVYESTDARNYYHRLYFDVVRLAAHLIDLSRDLSSLQPEQLQDKGQSL